MSGVNCPIDLDTRHIAKHLPNTPQMQRLLKKGLSAHVFKDMETLKKVTQAIIEKGEYLGKIRKYERYGLYFSEVIGYRISPDGTILNLFYGEMKIDEYNKYHVIPRTKPSRK
ncbi:DUF6972 family protein [Geminocystis sp. GBBB08]|uniref:DUF6972 family protein n=1 Tax=Geminocystis sp. GBBB08 TaxID=2604140 RepID=UPI0027E2669A|nr:hypothetical protein [Geminocystis sp. GBBB08]MBL1210377.1 hypothetical protein [Geminocystis sp. GBBB08]